MVDPPAAAASLLPNLPPASRILVIRLRSIGDIVLLTPALRLLKEWRPDLRVTVLIENRFRELLETNPHVDEILEPGMGSGLSKLRSHVKAIRHIRHRQFDLCINLHGGPTSTALTAWSKAKWKVGFAHFRRQGVYDFLVPDARTILNQPAIHTAEHLASAFIHLGLPRKKIPPAQLRLTADDHAWWAEKRKAIQPQLEGEYAVIHPTALYATKQWSSEGFAVIGNFLQTEMGLAPVYSCGPREARVPDAIERASGGPIRRVEGARLRHFAAVLAGARLFVGNDSGPAHMAAAVGCPGVVIFGSSSSTIWAPWRPEAPWHLVQNHYECNPCPGDRCYQFARPECILSITVEQVRSAVRAVLAEIR